MHRLVRGDAVDDLLEPYAVVDRAAPADRPWVLANMVAGLDGSAAFGGRVGPLSEGADATLFRLLRAVADVVLVGAATVRAEGYGPVRLPPERGPAPPLAVVTRSLDLDFTSAAFTEASAPTIVVTTTDADASRVAAAKAAGEVLQSGASSVDLRAALCRLRERGHRVVLCEGGPTLLGELVELDLLDELCLTVAPIMGGDELPVAVTAPGAALRRFALRHTLTDGASIFLRYERDRAGG